MLENLLNLVREHASESIVNNPVIPNEQNEAAITEVTQSLTTVMKSQLTGENSSELLSLFGSGSVTASNPLIGNMIKGAAGSLMQKFGISASQAGMIANSLIPKVMSSLVTKTNDPADSSFTMEGIAGALTGGKPDIRNMPGGLLGEK